MGQEADTLLIHFHQDKIYYDAPYLGNDETMRRIAASVEALGADRLEGIDIIGYASPEGATGRNDYLSRKRSDEVFYQVKQCIPQWASAKMTVRPGFESWDLLRRRIREDEQLSEAKRSQIVAILDDPSVGNATKKWRLMNRLGTEEGVGDVWEYLFDGRPSLSSISKVKLIPFEPAIPIAMITADISTIKTEENHNNAFIPFPLFLFGIIS